MTARAEYDDQEWTLLQMTPFAVGFAVSFADGSGALETFWEVAALVAERARAIEHYPGNELLAALFEDKGLTGRPPDDAVPDATAGPDGIAAALRDRALEDCRAVVALLEDRSHPDEAEGYKRYLMDMARATAEASRHGGWLSRSARVDEQERALLCEVADVLGVPVGGPPGEVECGEAGRSGGGERAPSPDIAPPRAGEEGPDIPSGPIGPE
jgi:hypothetical protein